MPPDVAVRRLPDDSAVWIGRPSPGLALDEILLERLAIAAAILLDQPSAPPTGLGDPALVELADHIGNADIRAMARQMAGSMRTLRAEDVAAVLYVVGQPSHVSVNEILLRPTDQVR